MMNCLAVGLGGFAGAVLRYLIGNHDFSGKYLLYQCDWMYCDRSNHSTGGEIVCSTKDDFVSEGGSLRWIYNILNLCTGIFGFDPGWTYGNSSVLCIT